ncbi:hypothetical protein [Coleofasciculus sp. FACHB-129]|uniref:hypothetical protein n=1 Tax=Cyanophyceae TaxID=3028117 RepID=UPI00168876B8|nr:hypothetical protein [Coleofasciculus sp. FACHB-129]MBD1895898.1 hypothetical protein [Coleofasciculus sp. FACHB-129]
MFCEESQLFTELTLSEQEDLSGGWGWPSWKQVRAAGVVTAIAGGVISAIPVPGSQAVGAGVAAAGGAIFAGGFVGESADDLLS